jgi:DNA-binding CsgD family transcriptional regulator
MFHSEYIYKDDIATFIIELKDNELFLHYSDEKSCDLLGLKYPYQEYISLTEIFPIEVYKMLLDVSSKIGITCNVIKLTKNICCRQESKPYSLTLFSHPSNDKKLVYVCCSDSTQPEANPSYEVSNELRNAFYNVSFDMLFNLQMTLGERILLMNYNKAFLSYFNRIDEYYNYSDLSNLLPPAVFSFFDENSRLAISKGLAFSRLLDYNCTPFDHKTYLCPPKDRFTLLVTFFPLCKENTTTVLCCARDIMTEFEAKCQTQELLEEYNALFTATANAVAIFTCDNPYHPILEKSNPRMLELSKLIGYDSLFSSTIWHNVFKTHSTVEDMFTVQIQSKTLHFKVIIIPILHNGVITKAIVSAFDITDQVNINVRNYVKLTKREEEIVSYVITGEKNDFIAAKLCVSVGTIKKTLSNAYSKLGISSRVELLNYFHSHQFDTKPQVNSK